MAAMRFEYKPSAGSTWSTACTDVTPPSPFSCSWNTTTVADGSYDVRSVADRRRRQHRATRPPSTARIVDNTGPAVSVTSPGMFRASTTISATATDADRRPVGGDPVQPGRRERLHDDLHRHQLPYSCAWNAAARPDGAYDIRAIATDTLGNQSTSAVVSAYVNNTGPTGTDVQAANGGVNDKLDAGDMVTFSYSADDRPRLDPRGLERRLDRDRVRVNNNGTTDSMEFYDAANTTPLGLTRPGTTLAINIDHVSGRPASSTRRSSRSDRTITVTIGSLISGAVTTRPKGKNDMVWQTSSQATSLATGVARAADDRDRVGRIGHRLLMARRLPLLSRASMALALNALLGLLALGLAFASPGEGATADEARERVGVADAVELQGGRGDLPRRTPCGRARRPAAP